MNNHGTDNPAIIIAGAHSGSGKTTVTLGIMAALKRRGLTVQPYKCGPDFIDPSLHKYITGRVSRNLDLLMMGNEFCKTSFCNSNRDAEISVIEGVMGMFDGELGSSYALGD
ncbi:MAG TPA: cobyrinate a,c-diamide synthase, partial [Desulfobacterales bacterium]|nr:cobyrinate a,c-diamide synthase [Desulfobacterales bacterium]